MNKAYLTFVDQKSRLVTKGDVVAFPNGESFTFIDAKRTRWIGQDKNGKKYSIPFRYYPLEITGKDSNVTENVITKIHFKPGELFTIQGKEKVFMFKENDLHSGKLVAYNIATGTITTIDRSFIFESVNINKYMKLIKEE